jgi:DNA-binding response OmpR family regulator
VLVVEDPVIQRFVSGILKREGCQVVEARAEESLRILRTGDRGVALLITNQPLNFLEFAEILPLIYVAAAPDSTLAVRFRHCRTLRKPFPPGELVACVDELLPIPAV